MSHTTKHQWQCDYGIISTEGAGASEFLFDPFFSFELAPADRGAKKKTVGEEVHGKQLFDDYA
ncbi:MAG: hypothetical protein JSW00_11655 [Thermoplasmata archaeon]|nr:MAG: hypothetical protein JSW00_11655 [Thermoplasmata archaeon]